MHELKADHINNIVRVIASIKNGKASIEEAQKELIEFNGSCSAVAQNLLQLIEKIEESRNFILAISSGKLSVFPPRDNHFIAPFKQLHSDLLHLTWQTKQIAEGDYNQKVSFMGDFSTAFNKMIEALKDRKKLQDDLKESNATKDKFFSIIAHDLINPVGALASISDNMLEDFDRKDKATLKEELLHIRNSSHATLSLLENLLTWSRSQRGSIPFNPGNADMKFIAQTCIETLQEVAAKKNIKLSADIHEPVVAFCDAQMITTVVRNLVSNAIKFTPDNGAITICGYQNESGSSLTIEVSDTGVGMTEENIKKLFSVDKSFSTNGTNNEKGTGLGLILCKEFIEKNEGSIWVVSEPGKGSKFCFTLPVAVEQEVDLSELFN